jgi:hypothetical protein
MNIIIFTKCCGHGAKEIFQIYEFVDHKNIHIARKDGFTGQKKLQPFQRNDNNVYIEMDNNVYTFEEWMNINGHN